MVATMPKRKKRDDIPVKISPYAVKLAKRLAAHEDSSIAKVLSDTVIPLLIKKLEKAGIPFPPAPPPSDDEQSDDDQI